MQTAKIETVYTYEEWERLHYLKEIRRKRKIFSSLKQKATGLFLVALGILTPFLLGSDATASVIFIPVGMVLLLTRENILER